MQTDVAGGPDLFVLGACVVPSLEADELPGLAGFFETCTA